MYTLEMYNRVKLDSNQLRKTYTSAGRTYKLSFFTFRNDTLATIIENEFQRGNSFENIFFQLTSSDSLPQREISFKNLDGDILNEAIFSDTLSIGQIIGPLKVEDGSYLVIKINGWTDELAITEKQIRDREDEVIEKYKSIQANKIYNQYIKDLMQGKTVRFNGDTFKRLVNIIGEEYYRSEEDKKQAFNQKFWNKDQQEMVLDDLPYQREQIQDQPLLTIDGETWTVRDFERAIVRHPLVFRKRNMSRKEFAEQFKLAIVDLIRDQHITEDAYRKGYDKVNVVERNYHMWRDNLLALYQRERYLRTLDIAANKELYVIEDYLNPYVQELQKKYNDIIEINMDNFEDIKLTSIDMFVIQRNVPFPVVVPSFPKLTTHDKLDYGKKMQITDTSR